jgi:hypothetical protein
VLQSTSLVSFGRVEHGSTATRRFVLRNETALPVMVGSIAVGAPPFQGPAGLALPLELAPGASTSFEVLFSPTRAGIFSGTLTVDKRAIPLEGVALDPPFPAASIHLEDSALQSGRQVKVSIRLAAPSPVTGAGTLTLALRPTVSGVEDAAVLFLANGERTVTVSVTKGEDVARVNNQTEFYFQTGTTAGELSLELKLGFQQLQVPFTLAPAQVRADSLKVTRTPTGFEAAIEGFDNTRTLTHATFTFYDSAGKTLGAGPMRLNLTDAFTNWWRQSGLGGAFLLRAAFPVAGDATLVTGVTVEFENSLGRTSMPRVSF